MKILEFQQAEMRTAYRDAADKGKQIKILSELYACSKAQVLEALGLAAETDLQSTSGRIKGGAVRKGKTAKKYAQSVKDGIVRAVILEGVTQREASERFCVPFQTVHSWVQRARKTQREFLDAADAITAEASRNQDKTVTPPFYSAEGKRVPAVEDPEWQAAVEDMVTPRQETQMQVVPEFEAAAKKADREIEMQLRAKNISCAAQAFASSLSQLLQANLVEEKELLVINRVAERAKIFHAGMLYAAGKDLPHEA